MKNIKIALAFGLMAMGGQMMAVDVMQLIGFFGGAANTVKDAKQDLKNALQALAAVQPEMAAIKAKLADKTANLTDEQRDFLRLSLLEIGIKPISELAKFLVAIGDDLLAKSISLGASLNDSFKSAVTFKNGQLMSELLHYNLEFLMDFAKLGESVLPKVISNMEKKNADVAATKPVAAAPVATYDDL